MTRVPLADLQETFERVLRQEGFSAPRAALCARIFAENTLDGVNSHGVNRFPSFVEYIRAGYVRAGAEPKRVAALGAWEQWNGQLGPGPLNAHACTERAMELAREHGVGCVALRNTNHWMRGGAYGWQAARAGFALICWTNTTPNMPPWGAVDAHVGNNPLVLAVPRPDGPIVLDMAMSQFSYGRLGTAARTGERLPVPGGFDDRGRLTDDPEAIITSGRALPVGYWKGAGLALLLDLVAALASGGSSTAQIGQQEREYGVCQMFIALDLHQAGDQERLAWVVQETIDDLHNAELAGPDAVRYPGERALQTRNDNLAHGVPVDPEVWKQVLAL